MSQLGSRGRRPTLEAVAERAGVGRGTVSRVINGSPKVSERARAAVEAAIAELGYVPNRAARALVTQRTDSIALIIPESESRLVAEPYFIDVIRGVGAELAGSDTQLLLILVRTEQERRRLANYLAGHRVDGVLMVSVHADDPLLDVLGKIDVPAVLNGRRSETEPLSHVNSDNFGGGMAAVRHLAERGRRVVATITGPLDMDVARSRLAGYRKGLEDAGLPVDDSLVAEGDFSEDSGRRAMRELLERRPDLDAVFAASDVMASGALQVLREADRSVPRDVALVGFDDSVIARHTDPPLTSVRHPIEETGRTMARLLLEEIAEPGRLRRQVVLPTELVRRRSS